MSIPIRIINPLRLLHIMLLHKFRPRNRPLSSSGEPICNDMRLHESTPWLGHFSHDSCNATTL
nr:MAG TPA: hypothetical protein [Caudoviricetes sp.]